MFQLIQTVSYIVFTIYHMELKYNDKNSKSRPASQSQWKYIIIAS